MVVIDTSLLFGWDAHSSVMKQGLWTHLCLEKYEVLDFSSKFYTVIDYKLSFNPYFTTWNCLFWRSSFLSCKYADYNHRLIFSKCFSPQTQKRILQRPDTEIFKVGRANWGRMSFVSDRDLQLHSAFIIIPPHSATLLCGVCLFINIPHWLSWAQCSI